MNGAERRFARRAEHARGKVLHSGILEALRAGRLVVRAGIERYDGHTVHFTDGTCAAFDAVIMATGFRIAFPFLSGQVTYRRPPYLRMMDPAIPNLFFIGLFQPIGCIWRLADYQARIAAQHISGRLGRLRLDPSPRQTIEVDYHAFRRDLMRELAGR